MNPRPYQSACRQAIIDHWRARNRRLLCVLATGTGKAMIAAHTAAKRSRTLFLVHRDELASQAADKFHACNPTLRVGIEKAEQYASDADIVIASVPTLGTSRDGSYNKRLSSFNPDHFAVVQADESHHCIGSTWQRVLRYMRVLKGCEHEDHEKLLLGWTATPNRGDNLGLEKIFTHIAFNYGIRQAIEEKYLAPITAYRVETSVDLSHVKVTSGDFDVGQLSDTINTPQRNELICQKYGEICPGEPALFFSADIAHSNDLANSLCGHGWLVYPLSGKTSESERKRLIAAFKAGEIHGLVSCGVLDEGTDLPNAKAGFLCRPTKSSLRYRQNCGRILRPFPSPEDLAAGIQVAPNRIKDKAILVDFCDTTAHHQLVVTAPTLFGLRAKFDGKGKDLLEQAAKVEQLKMKWPTLDVYEQPNMEAIESAIREIGLLSPPSVPKEIKGVSRLPWLPSGENSYHISVPTYVLLTVREDILGTWEAARHEKGITSSLGRSETLKGAISLAEKSIPPSDASMLRSAAPWRKDPPSEPQARRVWQLSAQVKERFKTPAEYFAFCERAYGSGDRGYSKGSMSARLDTLIARR